MGPAESVVVAWRRDGARAVIEVSDGGPGVAPGDRERVFEPFFSTRDGGTGLGLALAREAAERHGGTIGVVARSEDDAPRAGALFRITLPAARPGSAG